MAVRSRPQKKKEQFFPELWKHLWATRRSAWQVRVAILTTAVSIFIGLYYDDGPYVPPYIILVWLALILVCFLALYPFAKTFPFRFDRTFALLTGLTLIAFFIRIVDLRYFPPGFHIDEVGMVDAALRHVLNPLISAGTINPFRTGGDSHPMLYYYIVHFGIWFAGFSFFGARITSVIAGSLAIPGIFLMMNELTNRRMAWISAGFVTVYQYHVHWSHIALNNIWVTLFLPLAIGFFLAGWRLRWSGGALFAGFCLGMAAYSYAGGYILFILLPILIWQIWSKTKDHISLSVYIGKTIALGLVTVAPLLVFTIWFPSLFTDRANTILAWKPLDVLNVTGNPNDFWDYFWFKLLHAFGGFNFCAESAGFYGSRFPFLIGPASILFLVGVVMAVYEKKYFLLFWILLVCVLGGFMTQGFAASSHFIGSIPAICWLVALPIDRLFQNKYAPVAWFYLVAIVIFELYFYFVIYHAHPSVDLVLPFPHVEPYVY